MTKVMHIVLGLQVGGLEKFVLDLIDNYSPQIEPVIVCLEANGALGRTRKGFTVLELEKKPGISIGTVRRIVALAKAHEIDLIHTHNPGPHFYGAMAGFLARRPVIHTKHGRNYPTDVKKVWLNRISSFLTRKIVAVSQDAADVCVGTEKIPSDKVCVVLNGVDSEVFAASTVERKGDVVTIGIVARLSAEKDHQTLLQACRLLADRGTRFHLNIIGDGPLRDSLETKADELGISHFVTFAGMSHNVPEELSHLDVYVLSSVTEGISLTLLEAMSTCLPVVATAVGGNPEVVVDGETGFLVAPRDPQLMAEKLLHLVDHGDLRRRMGEKGRQRVIERFSIKETAKKYEKLYDTVLNKR